MWTVKFWKKVLERVVKSVAEAFLIYWGGSTAGPVIDAWHFDWQVMANVALSAAVLTVLLNLVTGVTPTGPSNDPSAV